MKHQTFDCGTCGKHVEPDSFNDIWWIGDERFCSGECRNEKLNDLEVNDVQQVES